jgi:hypothetical protein
VTPAGTHGLSETLKRSCLTAKFANISGNVLPNGMAMILIAHVTSHRIS